MSARTAIEFSLGAAGPLLGREVIVPLAHVVVRPADFGDLVWQDKALCAQVDPEIFFPEKGGSTRDPKRVCRSCEVRAECLEYALENDERFGIWGGLSERERRRVKRQVGDEPAGDDPADDDLADDEAGDDDEGPQYCPNRLHLATPENTYTDGRCRLCRRSQRAARRLAGSGSTSRTRTALTRAS
jgi:WhiB family redox-sensing transcriptional regulator